jgi:YVTN family beta-propeller protein
MKTWHISAVRVPLNEGCWLDTNGSPAAFSGAAYRDYIVNYTMLLQANGIRPILDLHWNNASTSAADNQQPMADQDHSPAFWTSVASIFKNDPAVIFDLYNEPWGITWACWDHGCFQTATETVNHWNTGWQTAGMQELVNVTRAAGARNQLLLLGGLNWANDLSDFLSYLPIDPAGPGHLAASIHLYDGENCDTVTCWDTTIQPILTAGIPVIVGELGETDCNANFIRSFFSWADPLGIPFLGWAWTTFANCGNPTLIANYSGTPYESFGAGFEEELKNFTVGTMVTPPYAPESVMATPGAGSVQLKWNAPTLDGNASITNYTVLYGPTAKGFDRSFSVGSAATSADITGLPGGASYSFAVEAWNAQGAGPWSSNISATPLSPPPPQTGAGTVKATLCLFNDTLLPGNAACPDGLFPAASAFDTLTGEIYIANSGSNNVSVISNDKVISYIRVGISPDGVVYDAANGYIYVANSGSNNVSVISGNRVIAAIPVGSEPYGLAYDSDNLDIYVTNTESDNVSVISGVTNAGISIPTGAYPTGIAYVGSNSEIFVANYLAHNVTVFCGASVGCGTLNKLVTNTAVGNYPYGVVFDSINGYVYVANSMSDNVTVICALAIGCGTFNKVVTNIAAVFSPYGEAFSTLSGNVYITEQNSNNVTVICGVTGISCTANKITASVPVGSDPEGVTYDTTNGYFYVANSGTDNVTVINGLTNAFVTSIVVGLTPLGDAANSANGDVYLPISNANSVTVVSGATDRIISNISVGLDPVEAVFDSANGYVYVANNGGSNVTVIDPTAQKVLTSISVGKNPYGLAYDPLNKYVYATSTTDNNVSVINGTTNNAVSSISVGASPTGVGYDPQDECIYVSNQVSGNVSVVNTTNDKIIGSFNAFFDPMGVTYSPLSREAYVAVSNGGMVLAASGSTVVHTIDVGAGAWALDFDSANGFVYAADNSAGEVSVINRTDTAFASINVSANPEGVAFDNASSSVYVANHNAGSVSIIGPTMYNLNFTETGLPSGTSWGVTVNGSLVTSTTGTVHFTVTNGTYLYAVPAVPGYTASPNSGNAKVSGGSVTKAITFTPALTGRYSVTFNETGLPAGTSWSVVFNGSTSSSATSSIVINNVVNNTGGYAYTVSSITGYTASPTSGSIPVTGGNAYRTITFTPAAPGRYSVTFTESGLKSGTNWSVLFNSTTTMYSTTTTIVINGLLNSTGGYPFNVGSVSGYSASPASGVVPVNGADAYKSITFTPLPQGRYSVTFDETGLPTSTSWSVTMNGATNTSATSSIVISNLLNNTYPFTVGAVAGYAANPPSGNAVVSGASVVKDITFTASQPGRYSATFSETGLVIGTIWSVTINGATNTSGTSSIVINDLVNNTYPFTVNAVAGYTVSPTSGNVVIAGSDATKPVAFTALPAGRYSVTFAETGLPGNTNWSVTFNATLASSTTASIVVTDVANGKYSYTVGTVSGYTSNQTSGSVTVNGTNANAEIAFTKSTGGGGTTNNFLGLPGMDGYLLLIAIAVVVVVVVAVLLTRKKGGSPKTAAPAQAPQPQSAPPPTAPSGGSAPPAAPPPSPQQPAPPAPPAQQTAPPPPPPQSSPTPPPPPA